MIWRRVTLLGGATATIGVGVVLVLVGERHAGIAALLANLLSHLPVQALKRLVARPRPCDAAGRPLALVELPDPFSFPSGHAAAAVAVAAAVAIVHPWTAVLGAPLAALVAWSRVALRVHHLSDVLAGVLLGLAAAAATAAMLP